jgi:hypothetical protein
LFQNSPIYSTRQAGISKYLEISFRINFQKQEFKGNEKLAVQSLRDKAI